MTSSCRPKRTRKNNVILPQNEKGNLSIHVSNQSYDINTVDINVLIDDKIAIHDDFDVKGNQTPQHNWQQYRFQLENGEHKIIISSLKGNAKFENTFEISGSHVVIIAYWYDPKIQRIAHKKYFTVEFRDKSIAYM